MAQTGYRSRLTGLRTDLDRAGCRIVPSIGDWIAATCRWNGALAPHPALIVQCDTAGQVATALRAARAASVPVSVYGGGHDWEGRSFRDDTVVLDISAMTLIEIDREKREAVIGGGVTAGQLNEAAGSEGLAVVIGSDGAVGMAGLLLGGGYGPLMTRYGLACDNLLSAEVVLPDGTVVSCDAQHEADLFWALRGGGGNFGVVTSMRLRLHALDTVFAGTIIFAWADARAALSRYAELMLRAPAELFGSAILSVGPGGGPVVVVSLVWTGEAQEGAAFTAEVAAAGNPVMMKAGPMPAVELLSLTNNKLAQGRGYEVATRWFRTLAPDTIEAIIAGFDNRTSPLSSIIVHHCHGAATQVPPDATAFGMREPHFTALIYGTWEPATENADHHRNWTKQLEGALTPAALPGGYASLLSDASPQQIAHAYGPNAPRLLHTKAHYDPEGILRAIPLPASS
jgi:hypothetical protein